MQQRDGESNFGSLLREYRTRAGLTQEQLAEQAGLSRRGIADLERGARRAPYSHTVERLAAALRLAPAERTALMSASRQSGGRSPDRAVLHQDGREPGLFTQRTNVVPAITSFIGREQEVADLVRLLTTTRLLTLTGPGGVGKTRLAVRLASENLDSFPDGVWLVDLAPLARPDLVAQTVAYTIGVRAEPDQDIRSVLTLALARKRALIVLDNCEHLVEACARVGELLVGACANLHVIATSREPLAIPGERNWRVAPLKAPDPRNLPSTESLGVYEAVRLFLDRAMSVDTEFVLTDANAKAVAQICARLDGVPLAIELAAARVNVLAPEQIASRLDDQLRLLTHGSRTAMPRQQTLRALVDWSHDLLSEPERVLFRRLSVFSAGCTLEAAEAVCSSPSIDPDDVLDLLAQLIDKSLVMVDSAGVERRYRLLETLRQYSQEKLAASGETAIIEEAQARYYVHLVEAVSLLHGRRWDPGWGERIERDYDNIRTVLSRCAAQGDPDRLGLQLAGALGLFWWARAYWIEGQEWIAALLATTETREVLPEREVARVTGATLAMFQGQLDAAAGIFADSRVRCMELDFLEGVVYAAVELVMIAFFRAEWGDCVAIASDATPLAEQIDSPWIVACFKSVEGFARANLGQVSEGGRLIDESVAIARVTGEPTCVAGALAFQANFAQLVNDEPLLVRLLRESIELARDVGHLGNLASYLTRLADVELQHGHFATAAELTHEAIPYYQRVGSRQITRALLTLAGIALGQGETEQATLLLAAVDASLRAGVSPVQIMDRTRLERYVEQVKAVLPGDVFAKIWHQGPEMSIDEVVALGRS